MTAKMPTMKDVALLAGVSVQTVSCVVNNTGGISDKTRKRVLKAIQQLHYRRDPIARSMRTRQTHLIALLVLDITNPVLAIIASAVEAAAYAQDYSVLLYNVGQDVRREQAYMETVAERLVDGLIIVNAVDHEHTLALVEEGIVPTVLVDCVRTPTLSVVSVDNFAGAHLATSHLLDLGHRRIAHLAGALTLEVARVRAEGYEAALKERGVEYMRVVPAQSERWDYASGYQAMQALLDEDPRPTAVFAAGDQMAIGAYYALAEAGLRVPQDMSVVGFDDIEAALFAVPPLTTIRQPFEVLGRRAFDRLLNHIDHPDDDNSQVILPPELIIRQSTAPVT